MYRKENNLKECKRLFMAEKEQRKRPLSLKDSTEGISCPLFYTVIGCFLVLLHRLSVSPIQFAAVVLSLLLECERRKKKDPGRRPLVNWRPVSVSWHVYIYVCMQQTVFYNRKRNQTSECASRKSPCYLLHCRSYNNTINIIMIIMCSCCVNWLMIQSVQTNVCWF